MTQNIQESDILQEDARGRARALAHHSFIVEAPAGAGKTELLTQRFLSLLTVVSAPEEIIAITFTNKAAAEMRQRILDSLLQAASGEAPQAEHKKITFDLSLAVLKKSAASDWRLLENPARLRIFTIDGLCAYLARQMPLMSRFGTQPVIADAPQTYYEQAAEMTLALIESENSDTQAAKAVVLEALRYFDHDVHQLKKLLTKMLAMRDQWLHHTQQSVTPEALAQTLRFVLTEEMQEILSVFCWPLQSALMPLAHFAANNVETVRTVHGLQAWQAPLTNNIEDLPTWRALADLLLTGKDQLRKTITVKDGFPADKKEEKQAFLAYLQSLENITGVVPALARVRKLPMSDLTSNSPENIQKADTQNDDWQIIATLSALLNLAAAQLWLVFTEAREVDFAEVAKRATQALAQEDETGTAMPSDLALRLDYQIQHILVDEFQDTSPSQIALLEQLTQGWQTGDGRTLFAVGDPMQSIYRFRKANVGLFLNVAQDGIGDVKLEKLRLYRNNRSCPAVVDWINQGFQTIFPTQDAVAKGAISYRPFTATRQEEIDTGIEIHPIVKPPEMSAEEAKKREAERVIDIILRERATHPKRRIALLVRAKTHLQSIVSGLRRNHPEVKFQAVEIESLSDRQIIQDLLALTRALHHRADRVSWLAVLRAPWCGLTLGDLHALAGQDHTSTIWQLMQNSPPLSEDGLKRLQHVQAIFAEAFAFQGRVNISRWLRGVWLMLGGADCLWEKSDIVDVQAFFDCIEMLDRRGQFSLERMRVEIDKLFAAPDAEGEHLQMMTIHKSKGLEFDTVILPGLGFATGGNDEKPIVLWEEINLPNQEMHLLAAPLAPKRLRSQENISVYDYLTTLENERARNEDGRVLYVAATRAEKKLHFVGIANQNNKGEVNPAKNTYLELLWPLCAAEYLEAAPEKMENLSAENTLENFVPKLVRLEAPTIPAMLQQASHYANTHSKNAARDNEANHALEADIGTLTHQYLELIAKQGLENWPITRVLPLSGAMQRWFKQHGYAESMAIAGATQVQTLLQTTLHSTDGQWLLQNHAASHAELALSTSIGNETKHYVVDRTFMVDESGQKTRWIVDYKTDQIEAGADIKMIAEQYRAQLENYALLLNEALQRIKLAVFFVRIGQLVSLDY